MKIGWTHLLIILAVISMTPLPEIIGARAHRRHATPTPTPSPTPRYKSLPPPTPAPSIAPVTVLVDKRELYELRMTIVKLRAAHRGVRAELDNMENELDGAQRQIDEVAQERDGWARFGKEQETRANKAEVEVARLKPRGFSIWGLFSMAAAFVSNPFGFIMSKVGGILLAIVLTIALLMGLRFAYRKWWKKKKVTPE